MTMFYVATLAKYVLVETESEDLARETGERALSDLTEKPNRDLPINIRTVRPATADEIELWRWHNEMVGQEA